MELVAFVGKDKENWGQITALINRFDCEKVFLVKDLNAENFPTNDKCELIEIDSTKALSSLTKDIQEGLKKSLSRDFEVALSIASGSGKEHMALISALLNIPMGIKFIAYTKQGIEFLS